MRSQRWIAALFTLLSFACSDPTGVGEGTIRVSVNLSGLDGDFSNLTVSVDGGRPKSFAPDAPVEVSLEMGHHTVTVAGVAPNCRIDGGTTRSVGVNASETTEVQIAIACTALTGVVEVRAHPMGVDDDPDGYMVALDGASPVALPTAGVVRFPDLPAGAHSVALSGAAGNCSFPAANPVEVEVRIGGAKRDTARVVVDVACTALTGVVEVRGLTSGFDPDPDGYAVAVDGGLAEHLPPNGVTWFAGVAGGSHSVGVSGVASNCRVAETNPHLVNVSVGTMVRDTARVTFTTICSATTGAIRVRTQTTGPSPDGSYLAVVDTRPAVSVTDGTPAVLAGFASGNHSVTLSGIAANCAVQGANPATAAVTVGDTVEVVFAVACVTPPTTGVDVVVTTTGTFAVTSYHLSITDDCYYYYSCPEVFAGDVPVNGAVPVNLPAGPYAYAVSGVPAGCLGTTSGSFSIPTNGRSTLPLRFDCGPTGSVTVRVPISGVDLDPSFQVEVDGTSRGWVAAGGSLVLQLIAGVHQFGLSSIAANCAVVGPNPVSMSVVADANTIVEIPVTCAANPTLRVSITTTGTNAPPTFWVGVDEDWYYDYLYYLSVPANGSNSMTLAPGNHLVAVTQVPLNCTVTSANNVTVALSVGSTTDVAFTVTCQ
ncbi:MAG TPA: hypothetical protein PKA66_04695 [Gemmatimonadales bacterium]|nr:hypothetical protein [Gemmatimonadales bacterium]